MPWAGVSPAPPCLEVALLGESWCRQRESHQDQSLGAPEWHNSGLVTKDR